jgi:hypothetical protein
MMEAHVSEEVRMLREALRLQPSELEEPEGDLAVEKMGDRAFDWILVEVQGGGLTPSEVVRGLRLLARLTRQFCVRRKSELLDLTLGLAQSQTAHLDVRSAATHIASSNALIANGLSEASKAYGRSAQEVQAQVVPAVRRALEIGLTPEVESFAKEFLSAAAQKR